MQAIARCDSLSPTTVSRDACISPSLSSPGPAAYDTRMHLTLMRPRSSSASFGNASRQNSWPVEWPADNILAPLAEKSGGPTARRCKSPNVDRGGPQLANSGVRRYRSAPRVPPPPQSLIAKVETKDQQRSPEAVVYQYQSE